eukprot:6211819-Pleurochrysis_carterae.AAC.8
MQEISPRPKLCRALCQPTVRCLEDVPYLKQWPLACVTNAACAHQKLHSEKECSAWPSACGWAVHTPRTLVRQLRRLQ